MIQSGWHHNVLPIALIGLLFVFGCQTPQPVPSTQPAASAAANQRGESDHEKHLEAKVRELEETNAHLSTALQEIRNRLEQEEVKEIQFSTELRQLGNQLTLTPATRETDIPPGWTKHQFNGTVFYTVPAGTH